MRVRHAASFGLPGHIRVSVRPRAEEDRFLAALDALRLPDARRTGGGGPGEGPEATVPDEEARAGKKIR